MSQTVLRFAPSPTGLLHVGNIRIALANYCYARKHQGHFILRIDDTDRERSEERYVQGIKEDLSWLGITWDETFKQSSRYERYNEIKAKLIASGRLYPCYETKEELDQLKKQAATEGRPPIYGRAALQLNDQEKSALEAQGQRPHWRFLLNSGEVAWDDLVMGQMLFRGRHCSDPVLFKEDGEPTYTLASVVDDLDYAITTILRGLDHATNTSVQVQIMQALEPKALPVFGHLPLLQNKDGEISKRIGGMFSICNLRERKMDPEVLNTFLSKLGTSEMLHEVRNIQQLVAEFSLEKISRSTPMYDQEELYRLQGNYLRTMSYDLAREKITKHLGISLDKDFWFCIHSQVNSYEDIEKWLHICNGAIEPKLINKELTNTAADLLPQEWRSEESWTSWLAALKEQTQARGRDLFMPLRLALTGLEDGPELKLLVGLIGPARAAARLRGQAA